jgi:hypothetical protein
VRVLRRAEVGAIEDFLQPEDLHAAAPRFLDERDVYRDRGLAHLFDRQGRIGERRRRLDEASHNLPRHLHHLETEP